MENFSEGDSGTPEGALPPVPSTPPIPPPPPESRVATMELAHMQTSSTGTFQPAPARPVPTQDWAFGGSGPKASGGSWKRAAIAIITVGTKPTIAGISCMSCRM